MTVADVPVIFGAQIAALLWHPRATAPEFHTDLFRPPGPARPAVPFRKPTGGLWTTPPVTVGGEVISAFERWQRGAWGARSATWNPPMQVVPDPLAAIAVINHPAHWDAAYAGYPDRATADGPFRACGDPDRAQQLDWAALTATGTIQAVAITAEALSWCNTSATSLGGWDMPTVYWLDPEAFTIT